MGYLGKMRYNQQSPQIFVYMKIQKICMVLAKNNILYAGCPSSRGIKLSMFQSINLVMAHY